MSIEGGGEDGPILIPGAGEFSGVDGRFPEDTDDVVCALGLLLLLMVAERLNHAVGNMFGAMIPVVLATGELLDWCAGMVQYCI